MKYPLTIHRYRQSTMHNSLPVNDWALPDIAPMIACVYYTSLSLEKVIVLNSPMMRHAK